MRKLNEKEIESVSGALAQDAAPPKQNTEAIQSAQNKSTLTPFIAQQNVNIFRYKGSECETIQGGSQYEVCYDF